MSEIEEVQEQMKADMEAMKDQMTSIMKAMMSMRRMMQDNTAADTTSSVTAEADPTHPFGINQTSHPVLDVVGDVSSIGACRPRIFFINGFLCFLEDE